MFLSNFSKDFFIIIFIFASISSIIAGSFKLRDKLNKKIESGQLNKKQVIIFWVEMLIIVSVLMYYYTVGLYNLIYSFKSEIIEFKEGAINSFFIFLNYVKPAILISLITGIICFIFIKLLKNCTEKNKGGHSL